MPKKHEVIVYEGLTKDQLYDVSPQKNVVIYWFNALTFP